MRTCCTCLSYSLWVQVWLRPWALLDHSCWTRIWTFPKFNIYSTSDWRTKPRYKQAALRNFSIFHWSIPTSLCIRSNGGRHDWYQSNDTVGLYTFIRERELLQSLQQGSCTNGTIWWTRKGLLVDWITEHNCMNSFFFSLWVILLLIRM